MWRSFKFRLTNGWRGSVNSGGRDNSWDLSTSGDSVILSSRDTEIHGKVRIKDENCRINKSEALDNWACLPIKEIVSDMIY